MRKIKLIGYGKAIPENPIVFGDQTRYRLKANESLLDLIDIAVNDALKSSTLKIEDIDCIVGAMATPLQGIPCNAALIHERFAKHLDIPALDINTTCTSFITALDTISYLIDGNRYKNVLIVSGDTASAALNPNEKESYELFSDAATAFVVTKGEDEGIIYSAQRTWSEGAHDTEIAAGGGLIPAFKMNELNKEKYYFHMNGLKVLKLSAKRIPSFIDECLKESNISKEDIDIVIPHQASKALNMIMKKLGFEKNVYVDNVSEYGNMISASIPYTLCRSIEEGKINRGDTILLIGTAAGLTCNFTLLKF